MIKKPYIPQIRFMREFFKHPFKMGAITPSSVHLANRMIEAIEINEKSFIVELGAGTGAITKRILPHLPNDQFLTFEINPQLVAFMKKKYPKLNIAEVSAEELDKYLLQNDHPKADGIISGLPWAVFNDKLQDDILSSITLAMSEKATFVTFAYIHALKLKPAKRFKEKLHKKFSEVKVSSPVWRNIPPAIVYICKK